MPTVARDLGLSYGGFTIGGTSERLLHEQISIDRRSDATTIRATFLVTGTTYAAFASARDAAETAFRKPFQDVVVSLGASTIASFKQSEHSALEVQSTIVAVESDLNSGLSQLYRVTIECGAPADYGSGADTALRDWSVSVAYSPSRRRTVTVSGVYTAQPTSTLARAAYAAQISAKATAVLTALGGTFELVSEDPTASSFHDQTLRFTRVYREVIFGQGGSGDDPDIVEQHLEISRRRWSERNSPASAIPTLAGSTSDGSDAGGTAQPLVEIEATYTAAIDATRTTDLKSKWNSLRDWVISQMGAVLAGGGFALIEDRPSFDYDENRLSARLLAIGVDTKASAVIRRRVETTIDNDMGAIFDPLWTGIPTDVLEGTGPNVLMRTVRVETETVDASGALQRAAEAAAGGSGARSAGVSGVSLGWGGIVTGAGPFPVFGGGSEYQTGIGAGNLDFPNGQYSSGGSNGAGAEQPAGAAPPPSSSGWRVVHTTRTSVPDEIGLDGKTLKISRSVITNIERYRTTPSFPRAAPGRATTPGGFQATA